MGYIKFLNNDSEYEVVSISKSEFSENAIKVVFANIGVTNIGGFKYYIPPRLRPMGNYEDYKYIFKSNGNVVEYSKINEKYKEGTKDISLQIIWEDDNDKDKARPSTINVEAADSIGHKTSYDIYAANNWMLTINDVPESIEYTFKVKSVKNYSSKVEGHTIILTHTSLVGTIENKIAEMERIQQLMISSGCNITLTDGTVEHFTLTDHDQTSILGLSLQVATGNEKIPWHTSNREEACKYYSNADMNLIVNGSIGWITYHVTYFRDLRRYILSLDDINTVENVQYGDEIPIEYRSEVLADILTKMRSIND